MEIKTKNNIVYMILSLVLLNTGILSIFFPSISDILLIISAFIFAINCIIFDYQKNFGMLLFLTSFQILEMKVINISYFNLISSIFVAVFCVKYIVSCFENKEKVIYRPAIFSIILCLYSFVNFDVSQIYYIIANVVLILLIYLTFVNSNRLNLISLCKYFLSGVLCSSLIGLMFCVIPTLRAIVMLENRFCALNTNPNTLQFLCVISLAISITLYFKKYFSKFYMLCLVAFFSVIGILTLSKAFVVCFIILAIIYFLLMFKCHKKQATKELIVFLVFGIILILIFFDKFKTVISRFFAYKFDNILDVVSTGRLTLWGNYIKYWSSSLVYVIFGCGVSHKQPYNLGPHSGYIYIIYTFGIVGTILISLLIISYIKSSNIKNKLNFTSAIPLLMFLILSFEEYLFSSMRSVFLLCVILLHFSLSDVKNTKMIKVLFYNGSLIKGGTESYMIGVINSLNKKRFSVDVLIKNANEIDNQNFEILKKNGCNIYFAPNGIINKCLFFIKFWLCHSHEYDIAHINATNRSVGIISFCAKSIGCVPKVIFHSHMGGTNKKNKIADFCGNILVKNFTDVFAGCSETANIFMYGKNFVEKHNVLFLRNSIDTKKFKYNIKVRNKLKKELKINEKIILAVGRLDYQKNYEYLLKVFYHLQKVTDDYKLVIIGTGSLENELKNLANTYDLKDKVLFLGQKNNINEYMQIADCFVMTSLHEGLPIVAIEAQTSGLKCIFSSRISKQTDITGLVTFIDITDSSIQSWVDEIIKTSTFLRQDKSKIVSELGFDHNTAIKVIENIYES